jgi:biotin carboxylase
MAGTHEQRQETGAVKAKDIDGFRDEYADSECSNDVQDDYVEYDDEDQKIGPIVRANTYSDVMETVDIQQKTSEDIQHALCELHHASLDSITGD